jgi:hypothetical protein
MTNSAREPLYFEAIKENRGNYFVEYHPPVGNNPFATLNLVYPNAFELNEVAESMRTELVRWLARYPVPIMVSAFDAAEDVIRPNSPSEDGFLVGWLDPATKEVESSWKLNELPSFLNDTSSIPDWRTIYKDIPFRTDAEVKASANVYLKERRKQIIAVKVMLTIWLAVIPATWAIIQYIGPEWLGFLVMFYTLWRVWREWRKLMGLKKPTPREREKAEKERKMAHYYYHCERNPEGFSRLKSENFTKEINERTRKEAQQLSKIGDAL